MKGQKLEGKEETETEEEQEDRQEDKIKVVLESSHNIKDGCKIMMIVMQTMTCIKTT